MTFVRISTVILGFCFASLGAGAVQAEQLRLALVISNGQYANMPPLPRCRASSEIVRDAFRSIGFDVTERSNLGRGELDTTIGTLANRVSKSPSALAVIYYCGYALEFNGRSFFLPTSANIARETDILTQGIISKSLVDSLTRANVGAGAVLFDVFRTPGSTGTIGLQRLVEQLQPSSLAVIGANTEGTAEGPTPASMAIRDQLVGKEVSLDSFTTGMRSQLSRNGAVKAYFVAAVGRPAFLVGGPPEAPPPAAPQSTRAVAPTTASASPPPEPTAAKPATANSSEPAASAPSISSLPRQIMADEDQMTAQDRRRMQVILTNLGYYSDRLDGVFGPETRAAIRRYQFEIKAEMTGRLNAEQATRLVNAVR